MLLLIRLSGWKGGRAAPRPNPSVGSYMISTFLLSAASVFAQAAPVADGTVTVEAKPLDVAEDWQTSSSVSVMRIDPTLPAQTGVAGLVAQAPGIHLAQFGDPDSFTGVSIRGSTLRQVSVYLDGIPLNPDGSQAVNLSEWPVRALQRIEVYRGNAPMGLGGAAMGGAIQMVTADAALPISGGSSVASTGRYAADAYSQVALGRAQNPVLTMFLDGVHSQGHFTYFADNGTPYNLMDDDRLQRSNNRTRSGAGLSRVRAQAGKTRIDLLDAWLVREQGLPGHINNPARRAKLGVSRNLLGLNLSRTAAAHRLQGTGWWLRRVGRLDDRLDEIGLGMQQTRQKTDNLGVRVHHRAALLPWLSLGCVLGAQRDASAQTDMASDGREQVIVRDVQKLAFAAPMAFNRFGWTPVLHGTRVHRPAGSALHSLDPRMGVRHRPFDRLTLRSNAGTFLRPPTMMEMYGDSGTMVGNPSLRPERGTQWDVGIRGRVGTPNHVQLSLDASHFWNVGRDRIVWLQNGQKTYKPTNFGQTWIQGVEAVLGAVVVKRVETQVSLTWTQSVNLDTDPGVANNEVPGVPGFNGFSSVAWKFPSDRGRASYGVRHTGPNYWDATNWHRSAARTFHDVTVQLRPKHTHLQVEFGIENVFNRIVEIVPRNPLDANAEDFMVVPVTDFNGYPLPGRVWSVALRWLGGKT